MQLHCLCVETFAFCLGIYIKHSGHFIVGHEQFNKTWSWKSLKYKNDRLQCAFTHTHTNTNTHTHTHTERFLAEVSLVSTPLQSEEGVIGCVLSVIHSSAQHTFLWTSSFAFEIRGMTASSGNVLSSFWATMSQSFHLSSIITGRPRSQTWTSVMTRAAASAALMSAWKTTFTVSSPRFAWA